VEEKDLELGIQMLLDQAEGDFGDRHEIYLRLRQMIAGLRAQGMPVPGDLLRLEGSLEQEFAGDAAGQQPRSR
jgi:hypothetical protein